MARKDLIRTTATVDGIPIGEFRTFSGGAADSAERKAVNGAGQVERARGGRQTVENVVILREDDGSVDLTWLQSRRGKASMTVTRQPLDDDGNPRGKSWTYTGKLKRVTPGEGDAEAETDGDDFELEQSTDGLIT